MPLNTPEMEKIIEGHLFIKDLIAILNNVLNILPYETYNVYYKVNDECNEFIIGIGGVNDIRDIGDLYLSMKLGGEGDSSKPGACFYRRVDKNKNIIDHNHDILMIREIFKKNKIDDDKYSIMFDPYLGNLTVFLNKQLCEG